MQQGRPSPRSGFTLLELIVVCALIGMLLVAAVPGFRQAVVQDELRSDSRKLIGYIRGVREKTMRDQQPRLLIFDFSENRVFYQPETAGDDKEQESPILKLTQEVSLRDLWTKSGGKKDAGRVEVRVSRQGYMDRSVVHLENRDGDGVSLLLFPFSTDIEVRDGYYEPEI